MWGCPLGEMVDLEKLSETCREKNRWTFFVTSSPANVPGMHSLEENLVNNLADTKSIGGVASHVNGLAIF